jgi:hypothetical protein
MRGYGTPYSVSKLFDGLYGRSARRMLKNDA